MKIFAAQQFIEQGYCVLYSRKAYHNEVQPVPGVPQVGELRQHEAPSHHLGGRLKRVDCREEHSENCHQIKIFRAVINSAL